MPSHLQKVLFISHEASRTGATHFLLHLTRWLQRHASVEIIVLSKTGGPVLDDFRALGTVCRLDKEEPKKEWLQDLSLVYSNTGTNGRLVEYFARRGVPVISHLHELEHELKLTGPENVDALLRCSAHFVACSQAVRDCLAGVFGVEESAITVIPETIPVAEVTAAAESKAPDEIRTALGIPREAFVVGAAGTVSWRKGADLFLQTAAAVKKKNAGPRPIRFVWIGDLERSERCAEFRHDLGRLGLEGDVIFTGEQSNPFPFYRAFDLFCLPSREDPFPLVMLEAGALGKPTIAFEGSGGAQEYCTLTEGELSPYLDVDDLSRRICEMARPGMETDLARRGADAAEKVRDHFDVETVGPMVLRVMEETVARGPLELSAPDMANDCGGGLSLASLARPPFRGRLFVSREEKFGRTPDREFAVLQKAENVFEFEFEAGGARGPVLRFRLEPVDGPAIVELKEVSLFNSEDGERVRDFLEENGPGLSFSDDAALLEESKGAVSILATSWSSRVYTPKLETKDLPASLKLRLVYRVEDGIAKAIRGILGSAEVGPRGEGSRFRRMLQWLKGL